LPAVRHTGEVVVTSVVKLLGLVMLLSAMVGPAGAAPAATPAGAGFDYESAAVPSVCGFPAGRLEDGVMTVPASPDHDEGFVRLRPARRDSGSFTGSDEVFYAATLESGENHYCNDTIVAWRADGSIAGTVLLGDEFPGSEHVQVHALEFTGGALRAEVTDVAQTESDWISPTASGVLTLGLESGTVTAASRRVITERPTVRKFIKAIKHRQAGRARQFATAAVTRQALRLTRNTPRRYFMPLDLCVSRADDSWPGWVDTPYQRMCYLTISDGEHGSAYGLFVSRVSWNTFRIRQFEGVAG
jgi:hypothetical protein